MQLRIASVPRRLLPPLRADGCLPGPAPTVPQGVAATPLTTLAGPGHPNPSPLGVRGYFTDVHGRGNLTRVPSLFGGRLGDRSKPVSGGATLPTVGARPWGRVVGKQCSRDS